MCPRGLASSVSIQAFSWFHRSLAQRIFIAVEHQNGHERIFGGKIHRYHRAGSFQRDRD